MWRFMASILLASALCGCGDEAPALGGDDAGTSDADTDTDGDTDADADADSDADADVDSDADADTDTDADADGGPDSGPEGACDGTESPVFVMWDDAAITEPMQTDLETDVTPNFYFVFTNTEDEGTAVQTFELPCAGTWYVWGMGKTGMGSEWTVPNTFNVTLDAFAEQEWSLTVETMSSEWLWNEGATGDTPWAASLDSGAHSIAVRGGEQDWVADLPQLGPLAFVTDPEWTPPSL